MTIATKEEKWFKVKYGFGAMNQISIQADELEKALYAQKFGEVVQLGDRQINGKYIISIEPHWHKYTGWVDSYEPKDADDWAQIERDCPKDLEQVIRLKRERVDYLVGNNLRNQIGKNIFISEIDEKEKMKELNPELKKITDNLSNKFKI